MDEAWREIPGFNGAYEVSNCGRVRSYRSVKGFPKGRSGLVPEPKLLTPKVTQSGYLAVLLTRDDGSRRWPTIHRLVAEAFLHQIPGCQVNHRDGDNANNNYTNLEWVTAKANILHAVRTGLKPTGSAHFKTKLTEEQVQEIRARFKVGAPRGTRATIAREYGVSPGTLWKVATGRTRKYEPGGIEHAFRKAVAP